MYRRIMSKADLFRDKLHIWDFILAVCTGLFLGMLKESSISFDALGAIPLNSPSFWGKTLIYGVLFSIVTVLVFLFSPVVKKMMYLPDKWKGFAFLEKVDAKVLKVVFFIAFLVAWFPLFLAMYPGYLAYDGPVQLLQLWPELKLNAAHPVVHTLFMGGCISLGKALFHTNEAGLAVYSVVQAMILAYALAVLFVFLVKHKLPKLLVLLDFLLLAFHPLIQLFVFTTTKDVIFGALFLLLFLRTVEIVMDAEAFFANKKAMAGYVLLTILMALFRKQGIYCICLMLPFALWLFRKHIVKAAVCFILPIVVVLLFFGPVSNAFGVIKDEPKEMLSVPIQQLAYVVNFGGNDISKKDLDIIAAYIPTEVWGEYIPQISDPVKSAFSNELYEENAGDFFAVWWKLAKEYPIQYVSAFGHLTEPYWYMGNHHHYFSLFAPFYCVEGSFVVQQHSVLSGYYDYLLRAGQNQLKGGWFTDILISIATPVYFLFFCLVGVLKQKKWKFLVPMILLGGYVGSLFLGPVACMRYAFPMLLFNPLCFGLLFLIYRMPNKMA